MVTIAAAVTAVIFITLVLDVVGTIRADRHRSRH